jgi:signal transduction histidine kinase
MISRESFHRGVMMSLFVLALVIGATLLVRHLWDEVAWRSYYARTTIVQDCSYGIGTWPGSFEESFAKPPPTQIGKMPYRGTKQTIKTFADQYLYIKCEIPSSDQAVFFNGGRIFGDSQVRVDGIIRDMIIGAGDVQMRILPTDEKSHIFEAVSRGDDSGIVGLATLLPIYLTPDESVHRQIIRYRIAAYSEHPAFRMGMSLIILCLMFFIWQFGLRYADVYWLSILTMAMCCSNFLIYTQFFLPQFSNIFARAEGFVAVIAMTSVFAFLVELVRTIRLSRMQIIAGAVTAFSVAMATIFVPDNIYYDWRLQGQLQNYFGGIAVFWLFVKLLRKYKYDAIHHLEKKRVFYVMGLAGLSSLALVGQALLEDKYAVNITPLVQSFMIIGFTGFMLRDLVSRQHRWLLERQARSQLEQVNAQQRARIEIGNMLAHDLWRPLELVSLLPKAPSHDQLEHLRGAGSHALRILEDLNFLDATVTVSAKPSSLNLMVQSAWKTVSWNDLAKSESIVFECVGLDGIIIQVDPLAMSRVFQNLLGNAFDLAPIKATIRVQCVVNSENVVISVFNTGTFISEENRNLVFQRFWSGRGSQGLGLAIVKELIEAHAGRISCDSDTVGTSFTITFPRNIMLASDDHAVVDYSSDGLRIAVIDDDDIVLTAWLVAGIAADVITFSSPEAFLQAVQSGDVSEMNAILLDVNFKNSKLTGIDIAHQLDAIYPSMPVFLTSSLGGESLPKNVKGRIGKNPQNWQQLIGQIKK